MSSSTPPSSTANIINHFSQRSIINSSSLTNKYYALRHGQSLANIAKIISSALATSCLVNECFAPPSTLDDDNDQRQ